MPFRRAKQLTVAWATCLLVGAQTGCLWRREAVVSPKTIVSRQLCRQGIAAMEHNEWDDAEPLLAKAVDVCPEDPGARSNYASLLWKQGRPAEALNHLAEAIRLAPDDAQLRVTYGEMQLALGDQNSAREAADWALDLQPKLPGAWALRSRLMQRAGKPREALSDLHRAEGLDPKNADYQTEIAKLHLVLNQPDRALATLQSLSRQWSAPDEPAHVLALKGRAYAAMKRYDDATDCFLLASRRGEGDSETLYHLAKAQFHAGRPREAAAAAQEALIVDPQHAPSRLLLAQMGINSGAVLR
jgi:tetratricopeptide (TPR) repeat protein